MELTLPQIWLIVGLLMLVAELVSVVLVFVFFAAGALITALLASIGLLPDLNTQLFAFSLISVLSLVLLRNQARRLLENRGKHTEYSEYAGETAMVIKDIPATGEGKIYYRGAEWIALSATNSIIEAGSKVIIRATDGIKLIVEET
ncbi:NfeD family protein [Salmonirosea aquatica]|uniref:NfeD family protein n=1 Tax=Salmonirosea aquatica TaxID=2654236 RepID=A0A7C9FNR6_9BACT|nr:NfeD family protein [Cytophagaceae bacterium SJW1-29]